MRPPGSKGTSFGTIILQIHRDSSRQDHDPDGMIFTQNPKWFENIARPPHFHPRSPRAALRSVVAIAPMNTSIVIVEDEGLIALDLKKKLELVGYTIPLIADNAADALAGVESLLPS